MNLNQSINQNNTSNVEDRNNNAHRDGICIPPPIGKCGGHPFNCLCVQEKVT